LLDALHAVPDMVLEHHMMRCALDDHFELYEFPNDLARWCWEALGDRMLAEELSLVDPYDQPSLAALRATLVNTIEERHWEMEQLHECRPGLELHLMGSRLVAYDTGERFSVNANGEVALNHSTPPGGSTVRAYAGEASLTLGRFAGNALDLTAAAKVGHAKASSLTTTAFQAKANIYVASAVIIPLALTYANHTEDSLKSKLRLNIGLALNADALLGIARAR